MQAKKIQLKKKTTAKTTKPQKTATKKMKPRSKKLMIGLIAMGGALAAFGIYAYVHYAQQFKTVFYKGTTINGIDASFRTPEDVEAEIAAKAEDYNLVLQFRDDAAETISGADIDYHYVSDGSVQKLFDSQHYLLWPKGQFSKSENEATVHTDFDHEKLNALVSALPELQADNMTKPKNAKAKYKDGAFYIKKEKYGTTLHPEVVIAAADEAAASAKQEVVVNDVPDAYDNPTILEDDPLLAEQVKELDELASASITYQMPNGEVTLDGNTLKKWLVKSDDGHYSKDETKWEQKLSEFVTNLGSDIKVVDNAYPFEATGIGPMKVYSNGFGWVLDADAELEQTRQELAEGAVTTREPNWASRGMYAENWGFGKDYIEVDLSRQHMWVYIDSKLHMESDIVSGNMSSEKYTPSGIYFMKFKELDHILTGERDEEGNPEYETPCSYWMPFNGGIGFHDAWWRGAFGGEIYTYDGSHGCINMPLEAAGQLYEVITTEMPIVIYYSKGCPFEPERNKLLGLVDPETEAAEAAAAEDGSAEESTDDGSYDESYDDSGESYDESYDDGSYDEGYDESYDEGY